MSSKVKNYVKTNIDICRNCQGVGVIYPNDEDCNIAPCQCPVCRGGGRVLKTLNIEVKIEPYNGGSRP